MSHNYPYRVPPPHADMRPERGANAPPDGRHPSGNGSYVPPYSSPASAAATRSPAVPQENVLSLLSSCGLEPEDLARLAELPEDVLTVESLPHILQQMKVKKGVVKPHPSASASNAASASTSSFHSSSASRPDLNWEQLRSQPVQYPLISSTRLPPEQGQEHWGSPRTSSSVRTEPPLPSSSSSSSGYMADADVRPGPPKYGKTDPVPSFSPVGQRLGSSHFSDSGPTDRQAPCHRPTPPPPPHPRPPLLQHPTNKYGERHQKSGSSSSRSSQPPSSIPSMKQALDFHGTPPSVFPYACSLCDITVLSEKVWTQHNNSTQHADGQLKLLQEFPKWDCRVKTVNRDDGQSQSREKKGNPASAACAANQSRAATQASKNNQKKAKGKVVCVKFPPQSVDETYLRKLTDPFGKIVKILMFPSLAFVELGSVDQANDLVKFHVNYPPTVNGSQIDFSISSTFSFLQSSQVVSFTPAPAGEDGRSDLISIVKRFGVPLYTLFLPSMAYVEMKTVAEAQKLVDYYSSNVLRISDDSIRVSFSGEYKSLARISSAKKYEEPPALRTTKRTRTRSRSRSRSRSRGKRTRSRSRSRDKKARTRSKSREKREKEHGNGTRAMSADKSDRGRRTRTRSGSRERRTTTRSKSRDKSNREKETRARSRSRSKSQNDSRETSNQKTGSRSRDSPSREKRTRSRSKSRSRDKTSGPSSTETKSGSKETTEEPKEPAADEPAPVEQPQPEAADTVLMEEEEDDDEEDDEGLSVDDSDIEGMEVIAEDGEEVEDEDAEELEEEEEEEEEEEDEGGQSPAVKTQSPEHGDEGKEEEGVEKEEMKKEEEEEKMQKEEVKKEEVKEEEVKKEEEEEKMQKEEVKKEEVKEEKVKEEEEMKKEEVKKEEEEVKEEENKEDEEVMKEEEPNPQEETEAEEKKEPEEASETPLEEEDEAFPVDPENFITLDELGEDECGEAGEEVAVVRESEPDSSRVIYIRNLPPRFYSDAEFLEVLRGCGTAVRYLLIRSRREGFVEMSTPSEAAKAARELNSRPVLLNKSKLDFIVSRKYYRLTSGWPVKPEADSEGRSSRRSRRRRDASKKTPERETRREPGRKSPEQELRNTLVEESASRETSNLKETAEETLQRTEGLQEETLQRTKSPEVETLQRTEGLQDEVMKTPEKEEGPQINPSPEEETRGSEGPESREVEEKTPEDESGPQTDLRSEEKPREAEEDETKETGGEKLPDGLIKDKEEKSTEGELEKDSDAVQKPSKPVGVEFVRPVVGYFCNLCQLIYADEDEAKQEHCRTPEHYRRYQVATETSVTLGAAREDGERSVDELI